MNLESKYYPNSQLQIDILHNAILNSVDTETKSKFYYYENGPIENLVRHADELLLCPKSSVNDNNDVTQISSSKQNLVNEMIQ